MVEYKYIRFGHEKHSPFELPVLLTAYTRPISERDIEFLASATAMLLVMFKLIGMFPLFISVASAIPAPASLVPRVIPAFTMCGGHTVWQRRECVPSISLMTWRDICEAVNPFTGIPYDIEGYSSCPPKTVCVNILDATGDRSIKCVNSQEPGTEAPKAGEKAPQIGTGTIVEGPPSISATTFDFKVIIRDDMPVASVAAVVLSSDQSFALETANIIVGKIVDEDIVVCQGDQSDPAKARECYPNGTYSFKKGDVVGFTWGLESFQKASLSYTIWESGY